ncbi:MAG: SUMF1/EgtB/PvdO family nonheme iron enzyme [Planctomycetota bacterium]|nr:SUMF1/EgtB/PvdO family nonheme iron enzyme [Planctomycetota bacterium]
MHIRFGTFPESVTLLQEWYQTAPDPGTHSAANWALREWKKPPIPSSREPVNGREWYVNSLGMTMLRIPVGWLSRRDEGFGTAAVREARLTRPFFLCDRETSVGLFQQFMDDTEYRDERPKDWTGPDKRISPTRDHPAQGVSWYDAVLFCNWLSRKEGLTPCYQWSGKKVKEPRGFIDGKPVEVEIDVWEPIGEANGYRLPSEAEWEYACRAESATAFGHGGDESLLSKYAVFGRSRIEPCGSNLPNGWGLFDMQGNVSEWCADWYGAYEAASTTDDPRGPQQGSDRVIRGGSWSSGAEYCRSAYRSRSSPEIRSSGLGFRVARSSFGSGTSQDRSSGQRSPERRPKGDVRNRAEPPPLRAEAGFAAAPAQNAYTVKVGLSKLGGKFLTMGHRSTWSPDGLKIAFGRTGGDEGIQVLDVSTGKTAAVSTSGKNPVWSGKGGQWIAYVRPSDKGEEVWVVGASGGNPRKVAEGGFPSGPGDGQTLLPLSRQTHGGRPG